jgi:hypothetical protein
MCCPVAEITQAISMPDTNPCWRLVSGHERELVIGPDACCYRALYGYVVRIDTVPVLAVRAQREAGLVGP